jgi:hypothetical protein
MASPEALAIKAEARERERTAILAEIRDRLAALEGPRDLAPTELVQGPDLAGKLDRLTAAVEALAHRIAAALDRVDAAPKAAPKGK